MARKCQEHEIAQLHIFDLAALGMAKTTVIQEHATLAQSLSGLVLVEYPVVFLTAFKTVSKKTTLSGLGAMEDDEGANWSDKDVGCDADGGLPEIVTQAIEKLRADQKAANLSQDHFQILRQVAFSTKANKYSKPVTSTFDSDQGPPMVRHGFLLIPAGTVAERRGTILESNMTGLVVSAL